MKYRFIHNFMLVREVKYDVEVPIYKLIWSLYINHPSVRQKSLDALGLQQNVIDLNCCKGACWNVLGGDGGIDTLTMTLITTDCSIDLR
jgi:hypothetical protein